MNQPPLISLKDVSFRYTAEDVLEGITLEIHKGDFVGIIGPNGSGKTTLLRIILGLLKPQQGSVSLFDQPLSQFHEWWRIGYVPQKAIHIEAQFPVTVAEVVAQGRFARVGLLHRLSQKDKEAIDHALEVVGMRETRDRLIRELSGGQQQRVFIARALASEPELLILDEPTAGVDIESQEEFYKLLAQLKREKSLTLVIVSHDVDVVVNEVNQLVCINKRLVYHGSPKKFITGEYLEKLYGKERRLILHGH
jgi:zinc transport system ATP-binding protein